MVRFLSNFTVILSVLFLLSPDILHAAWGLNMTQGVTPISHDVYNMHMTSLYVCTAIGILVFGMMFWSIFHHRKSKGVKPAKFSHSTTVEIIWTLIPFAIIVALAIPATKLLARMAPSCSAAAASQRSRRRRSDCCCSLCLARWSRASRRALESCGHGRRRAEVR